jgi:hypothetical protein
MSKRRAVHRERNFDRAVTILAKDLTPMQFDLRQHAEFFKEMTYELFSELASQVSLPAAIRIFTDFSHEKAKLVSETFDWRRTA